MKPNLFNILFRLTLVTAVAGGLMSGCGRKKTGDRVDELAVGSPVRGALYLHSWSEYFDPEVLRKFEEETGWKVDYRVFEDGAEMEGRMQGEPETVDVAVIDSFTLAKWRKLSLLKPLARSALPNLRHLEKRYFSALDATDANPQSVPYVWGTTVLAYRKDRVTPETRSWSLLWDEKLKGRVMMIEDRYDPLATALLLDGKSPASESPIDYELATKRLVDQIRHLEVRYGSDSDVRESLVSGTIWAAMCYNGDAAMISAENSNIDYFIPDEGAPMWVDNLVIGRDAPHPEVAHQFLNFLMRPEIAAMNSNFTRYATPNEGSLALLDPELLKDGRIFPSAEVLKRCVPVPPLTAHLEELIYNGWHSVKLAREGHLIDPKLTGEVPAR